MISGRRFTNATWMVGLLALLGRPAVGLACAVCFGDTESPLAKGAVAGVAFLVGVVSVVLAGISGVGLFWMRRSRRLKTLEAQGTPDTDDS